MTGPEHYKEAERLVTGDPDDVAAAQVHATLALAAATAEGSSEVGGNGALVKRPVAESPTFPGYPGNEWGRVLS